MTKNIKTKNENKIKTFEYGWYFCSKSGKIKRYKKVKTWYI